MFVEAQRPSQHRIKQFAEMIASRTSKARELLRWKGQPITVVHLNVENAFHSLGRVLGSSTAILHGCNSFYVTLKQNDFVSYALSNVEVCFDYEKKRLALEIRPV